MALSVSQILTRALNRAGVSPLDAYVGGSAPEATLGLDLAESAALDIASAHEWEALRGEHSFTTVAQQEQTSGRPSDLERILDGTVWNETEDRRVRGPVDTKTWRRWTAGDLVAAIDDNYRLSGSSFLMFPTPSAGQTVSYEYQSSHRWQASGGGTTKASITLDTDTFRLDDELLIRGVVFMYKEAMGYDYGGAYDLYLGRLAQMKAQEGTASRIRLARCREPFRPDAYVPEGNWTDPDA